MTKELWEERDDINNKLKQSIKAIKKTSNSYATAERDYKILLRQECLKLRDEGMAIGMINLTCYGIPSVAEARFKRDIAEANYKANLEAINSFKLQLRLIDAQIGREWGEANGD